MKQDKDDKDDNDDKDDKDGGTSGSYLHDNWRLQSTVMRSTSLLAIKETLLVSMGTYIKY